MRRTVSRLKRRKELTAALPSVRVDQLGGVEPDGYYRRLWQADDEDRDVAAR
ncbi:hypothetical protein PICSAR240_03170 [Mycobacterium avium subsp. paratuberculosis]|nr:hypothetical protein MAP4_3667 [Mycobacterium avium subsp. paratuberculosis MAP4]ETB00479.1 hypothetical protein O978_19875 [Mycobacterium avium subsp. paratuberculosis 10-5864]ETB03950.1 hypothetical protein O979_08225 [Mycobacterium avium subsp. paratuberculosis 10-4404]ETB09374.1 hypothetical protein O980_19455 [Mycobacterium avium subsp. paratuberculosis 08-8281]ETB27863.1 hypothetical protein O977_21275 [Mycobacterium avium subsp. paratuberculosis 10-5975]ETB35486.1 hypothetical protei